MAVRKAAAPKGASKFVVTRFYRGRQEAVVAVADTLAKAKTAAAKEMFRYNDYDYAIYQLVGQVQPIVPQVEFVAVEPEPPVSK
jgi:hypothetical protein